MPRITRSHLALVPIALLSLSLASCFQNAGDCPTCPAPNSARLEAQVPKTGQVDSVHVAVDAGAQVTVKRDRRHTFANLSAGTHRVDITHYYSSDGIVSSRSATVRIELARGEARTITFHNDFPLITWAPMPGERRHEPVAIRKG